MSSPKKKSSSQKFWDEINARRSERRSRLGREFEQTTFELLREVCDEDGNQLFKKVVYHKPHGAADYAGKDFTVTRRINGRDESRSFGVTISVRQIAEAKMLHPDVPQFCFPIGTKPETIIARVLALFDSDPPAVN